MESILLKLYSQNKWITFASFSFTMIGLSWLGSNYLPFDEMMINSLSEQLSVERIREFTSTQKKWKWLGYLFIALIFVIKWSIITIPLYIGAIFFDFKITFKKFFQLVMISEIVFLVLAIVKFLWFYFYNETLTIEYSQFFMPLSLINFFETDELEKWFVPALQIVNLFEVAYWLLLAYFISKEIQQSFWKAFEFVLVTYGIGLLIWVIFISFLILNFN